MKTNPAEQSVQVADIRNARVLIVDDNLDLLKLISIRLRPLRLQLKTAESAEEALSTIAHWSPDLVITDLQMEGMSGIELFEQLHEHNPLLPVIILTAHGTIPEAVAATQSGIASYLTKPFDSDVLVSHIELALTNSGFTGSEKQSEEKQVRNDDWRREITTRSPTMDTLLAQMERLADTDFTISFEGEPGTGKEALARATHARSSRAERPFIRLNSTSQTKDLLDLEIFGRDANPSKKISAVTGLLRQANGGTLLVTDFSEAPVPIIKKLLMALISKQATPINSSKAYQVDVRALATTTSIGEYGKGEKELWDLSAKVDLTQLAVPPLRERREDIPLIANQCLQREFAEQELQFSNKALQLLLSHAWPGNVRQLISVVRQCARLTHTKIISDVLVNSRTDSQLFHIKPLTNAHRDFERDYLSELLKVTNGNVTLAATLAKRNRTEIHRLLSKHKMVAKSFRQ